MTDGPTLNLHEMLYRYAAACLRASGSAFVVVVAIDADPLEVTCTAAAAAAAAVDQEGAVRLVADYVAHVVTQIDGGLPWMATTRDSTMSLGRCPRCSTVWDIGQSGSLLSLGCSCGAGGAAAKRTTCDEALPHLSVVPRPAPPPRTLRR